MSCVHLSITVPVYRLVVSIWVLHAITLVFFGLRFLSRYLLKTRLGWDDFFTTVAVVCATVMLVIFNFCKTIEHMKRPS